MRSSPSSVATSALPCIVVVACLGGVAPAASSQGGGAPPGQPSITHRDRLACCHVAVKTIANLRALPIPGTLRSAAVRGYHAAEDGGGGLFAWDASSPEADDGGLVIAPAGAPPTGRWKRVYHGPVLLQWFGLTPNTDVGPALQTLFTSFGNGQGGHFKLMPGTYLSSVPLRLADPGHQVWDFSGVTLRFDANVSGVLFELGDSSGAQNYVFDTLVHAPEVIHEHASETDVSARGSAEETVGLRTSNMYHSVVHGIAAGYCTIGFQPLGTDGKGNVYNEYHLRNFKNCRVSVRPSIDNEGVGGTGWSNENLFVGGRFWNNWNTSNTLLEAHVILPGGFSCNQNTFLKPSFEGTGANAVRMIASANVVLHPRPEFEHTGGPCGQIDGEHASVTDFPSSVVTINPASTGNRVEMLYWDGDVEEYTTAEARGFGNRWQTRERSFLSLLAPSDGAPFQPQRVLERGAAILNETPADLVRDLYQNSGVPWGRRYESARSAVSESVAIGGVERFQRHHFGLYTTEIVGGHARMSHDTLTTPPAARILAGGAGDALVQGDSFTTADGVRWRHTGAHWVRMEPVHLAGVAIGAASTALAHGLPYTPTEVVVTPRANAVVWRSAAPTATQVFLQSSQAVTADVYVK